jgi:glucose/arabinose dehydrogenase
MRRRATISALALTAALACAPIAVAQTTPAPASATAPASTAAPASTSAPASSTAPGVSSQTTGKGSDPPTGAIVLVAVLGLILLVAAGTFAAARWWAWEPRWLLRWRHATAEAGWRTSAAWAEFRDWVRLGR